MEFPEIRRRDRLFDEASALRLLTDGEYGFLAMCSPLGYGYGIPVSYLYAPEAIPGAISERQPIAGHSGSIYIHSALEGHKIDAIRHNDRVSFCVVGHTHVMPYTTAYESVHVFGRIVIVRDEAERLESLRCLRAKYNPELADAPEGYMLKSMPRTAVLRLDIEHLSGKSKPMPASLR